MDPNLLQQIRDSILGITLASEKRGGLHTSIYLQEVRDAILSVTGGVFGNLNEAIYLQQIRDAVLGVTAAPGTYGSLNSAIYLQQIRDAYLSVASNPMGGLDEDIYLGEILPIATGGGGYDWHVDSVSGNDNNAGTQAAPFATITKLLTVWQAGQSVGLAKGSTWREQVTVPGNGCTIAAYGTGNKPILDCSDIIAAGGFTKTGGQTFVYQATVSPALAVADTRVQVWEDDVRLVHATSIANCDATAGSYYPSSETSAPITLYIHATDGSNPASNGKVYEFSSRQTGIDCVDSSNTTITGIEAKKNLHDGGSFRLGRFTSMSDCIARHGSKHNVYVRTGCTLTNVQAIEAYYDSAWAMFVYNEATPNNEGVTFINCSATSATIDTSGAGFYGHKSTSGSFGQITYTGCSAVNQGTAANGLDASKITYNNFTATNCNYGITCATDVDIVGGNIDTNILGVGTAAAGLTINISGGAIIDTNGAPNPGEVSITENNTVLSITDSIIGTTAGTFYAVFCNGPTGLDFTSLRNTFAAVSEQEYFLVPEPAAIESDYNTFTGVRFQYGAAFIIGLANWLAATGQDAHSTDA